MGLFLVELLHISDVSSERVSCGGKASRLNTTLRGPGFLGKWHVSGGLKVPQNLGEIYRGILEDCWFPKTKTLDIQTPAEKVLGPPKTYPKHLLRRYLDVQRKKHYRLQNFSSRSR